LGERKGKNEEAKLGEGSLAGGGKGDKTKAKLNEKPFKQSPAEVKDSARLGPGEFERLSTEKKL